MSTKDVTGQLQEEHWMNTKWRPMMGWVYMLVCLCDFVVFPVLWGILQAFLHANGSNTPVNQWQPLTLQGAGLFHLAMGAVLGLSAWGRTQEKINGVAAGPSIPGMPSMGMMASSASMTTESMTPIPQNVVPVAKPAVKIPQAKPAASVNMNAKGQKVIPEEDQPEL